MLVIVGASAWAFARIAASPKAAQKQIPVLKTLDGYDLMEIIVSRGSLAFVTMNRPNTVSVQIFGS
jgi:hypothetical protein